MKGRYITRYHPIRGKKDNPELPKESSGVGAKPKDRPPTMPAKEERIPVTGSPA